ncbi:MAG: tetratricopeptide repeat protein [Rhodovibrionaceae bacterium]|nr:tetratricopeptide repeat protein [Rhodovibrionaceae bacterium]
MNERIVRRFINIAAIALVLGMLGTLIFAPYVGNEPGDYEVKQGDIRLTEGSYEEAIESFNKALEIQPNHRGALMGRAVAYIEMGEVDKAEAELDYLIDYLERNVDQEDATGVGVLAAAYANRGVIKDRQGRHEEALADYIEAIRIDEGALAGPSIFDEIIYGYQATSVRDRAEYIAKELQKPEDERLLRLPPLDEEQRTYKP